VLPPIVRTLRESFPGIAIELVSSDSAENLLLREADIAVRMFRPTQLDLITRKLGEIPIVATAHESYLARRGTPRTPDELRRHDLIGFDRSDLFISAAKKLGFDITRADFSVRTDSQTAMWEMAKAGLGIAFAQGGVVKDAPGMVHLLPGFAPPPLEVWLTTHRELFTSRRIRAIYDRLGEELVRYLARIAA
jgi:DNA-binding transcriptional LysR family regulator